jgi:hypothetical protein
MPNTFELIASSSVGVGGAANIDFASIPSTYTDLCLKLSARTNKADVDQLFTVAFNGSTSSSNSKNLQGDGSSAVSGLSATLIFAIGDGNNSTATTFGNCEIYIPNYANTSYNKTSSMEGISETNATNVGSILQSGLWSSTAAINQITLTPNGGQTILQHSTAYLYGVKNA